MTPERRVSIAFLLRLDQIRFIKIIDGRILSLYVSDDQLLHLFQSIRSRHPVSEELCHYRANDIKGSRIRIPADSPFKLNIPADTCPPLLFILPYLPVPYILLPQKAENPSLSGKTFRLLWFTSFDRSENFRLQNPG